MYKKSFKRISLIAAAIFVVSLTACNNKDDVQGQEPTKSIAEITVGNTDDEVMDERQTIQASENEITNKSTENKINSVDAVVPVATKEISIYTINDTSLEVESVVALVPEDSEITPKLIVNLVTDTLAEHLIEVGIDDVTTQEDAVVVSFLSDYPPFVNIGSGVEETILDAYAQSLVDNLTDYKKVIFREEGKAYTSATHEFDINYVYLDGNKTN